MKKKKTIQNNLVIYGIQGGAGSFNKQAIDYYLKKHKISKDKVKIKYLYTTEKVLSELEKRNIDYGQFAMFNSVGGIVHESIEAIANYKFKIVEEFGIKIQHHLMKRKDVSAKDLKAIMTHPQVLKQCKNTLENKYPNLTQTSGKGDLIDNTKAAQAIAQTNIGKTTAYLGPEILSKMFDLEIIDRNLQDDEENLTTFLMVSK